MLAMRDVSAARETFHAGKAAQIVGNTTKESSDRHQQLEKVFDAGSFSISTMWAMGKQSSLHWLAANVTFRFKEHESPPYIEIDGLDTRYRILPDAVVALQRIDGMPTILITGWQAYRDNKGRFGSSHYSKDEALWIRTETNPVVGVTTEGVFSELLPFGRDAGHKVYEHKEGSKIIRYFMNSWGTQKIAEEDEVEFHSTKSHDIMELHVPGEDPKQMAKPDRDLMLLVDGMLGEMSCMGKPSTCAFRCFYDSENDVCGPSHFCEKVGSSPADNLAPFGSEQKCKAVGGPTHEAADGKITRKLEEIKRDVLDLTEKLERSPAISESDSGRSSLKETSALVQEANQMLNIMETFPTRLVPEAGDFPEAAKRAAQTDMKHWRRGRDRLTIQQYREAASKSISAVRSEKSYSVPAKLHNTLVDFIKKRPHLLIRFLKHETNDKCVLSDKTDSDRERLGTFLNYYMSVPGYSTNDLKDVTLDLPAHCQDYLVSEEAADPESIVQTAGEAQQILSNSTSSGSEGGLLQVKSERLARALGPDGTSFLQSGTSSDFAADESDRAQEVFFIIACIVVCLACFIVATMFFMLGFASLAGCFGDRGGGGGGGGCFAAYFVCMILGALIIWGAFAMATPVGIAALVASIVVLIGSAIFKVANLEIREHDFAKPPPPNWRAISHLAM